MLTQEKIDAMSNNKFIEDIIKADRSKFRLSEKRSIFKNTLIDGSITYSIEFDYTIIKSPTFFDDHYKSFTKKLIDYIVFKNKEDAEYYVDNAFCPSYNVINEYPDIEYKVYLYVKPLKEFYQYGYDKYIEAIKYRNTNIIYLLFKNNAKVTSTRSIEEMIRYLQIRHNVNIKKECVQTIEVNDIFNIKKTDIDKLKENIDETKDKCSSIIINEIERTQDYLEILKKML